MNNMPISYKQQMTYDYFQQQPAQVKGVYNHATELYKKYLYNILFSVYEFDIPETVPMNYFRFVLFKLGSGAFVYTNKFGWIFQPYSVTRLNLYYQPLEIRVENWLLNREQIGIVGVNSEIIRIFDDYSSIDDLVTVYAQKLAMIDGNIDVNLMNAKVAYLITASNKKIAAEVKAALEQIYKGNPYTAINDDAMTSKDGLNIMFQNLKNTYLVNDLLLSKRTIMNEFLTRIGIRNSNYDKRERLTTDEVSENNNETEAIVDVIFDNIAACFERLRKLGGPECKVRMRFKYEEEVSGDGRNDETDPDRDDEV